MKLLLRLLLIATIFPLLTAMGTLPGSTVLESIPVPAKNFSATFLDQMDVATRCSQVSIEGRTFLDGRMGMGAYVVPLERIQKVSFLEREGTLTARITLWDSDEQLLLKVDRNLRVYGNTGWGTFQIKLGDLKSITMDR